MRSALVLIGVVSFAPISVEGQEASPFRCQFRATPAQLARRPSPADSAETTMAGGVLKVCYGRPSARGRQIMGGLVPFGEPWRMGANEPTMLRIPFAAEIAGVRVEPGTYSLYAIPGDSVWEIVVNRSVDRWGIPINSAVRGQDVGSGNVPVERLAERVETLTIRFAPPQGASTELILEWERTRIRIPIERLGR